jgi:hypothetical protein
MIVKLGYIIKYHTSNFLLVQYLFMQIKKYFMPNPSNKVDSMKMSFIGVSIFLKHVVELVTSKTT